MSSVTKNSIRVFGCVAALAFSQLAPAASFVVHGSLDAGGETLATAVYTDGENTDVKAGQLIHLAVGLVQPLSDDFEVQGTVGWKFDNAGAKNGDITFDRYPVEGLFFFRTDKIRVGGGATIHLNPTLDSDGVAANLGTIEFDNALGFIAQVDMFLAPKASIGVRGTFIEYETTRGAIPVDGNSVGLVFTGRLK